MILRNHDVLALLKTIMDSDRISDETQRYVAPRGTPFGEFHRKMGSQELGSALLSWLLRRRLVFRSLDLECLDCGTSAWYSLDEVGNQFRCVGCQGQQSFDRMTHDASWRYRINQLLASALDQGILQRFWRLATWTCRFLKISNVRVPERNSCRHAYCDHVAEIDLFGFVDGEWGCR